MIYFAGKFIKEIKAFTEKEKGKRIQNTVSMFPIQSKSLFPFYTIMIIIIIVRKQNKFLLPFLRLEMHQPVDHFHSILSFTELKLLILGALSVRLVQEVFRRATSRWGREPHVPSEGDSIYTPLPDFVWIHFPITAVSFSLEFHRIFHNCCLNVSQCVSQ